MWDGGRNWKAFVGVRRLSVIEVAESVTLFPANYLFNY